jgi:hypothetical protein
MIKDIWTIVVKEWKELLRQRGNLRGGLVGVLVFVGAFGIFMLLPGSASAAPWRLSWPAAYRIGRSCSARSLRRSVMAGD